MASQPDPSISNFAHDIERLDQHFLDGPTADRIVERARIRPDDVVLDVGAGTGVLTAAILVRSPARVIAVEPDRRCLPYLERLHRRHRSLTIENDRIQCVTLSEITATTLVIANPPFSALEHLVRMVRELPELRRVLLCAGGRWAAAAVAGMESPAYGVTAVAIQSRFTAKIIGTVDGSLFSPPTRNPASLLELERRATPDPGLDLLAVVALNQAGLRVKDFVRSRRVLRALGAARQQLLRREEPIRGVQQRRIGELSQDQFGALARSVAALDQDAARR